MSLHHSLVFIGLLACADTPAVGDGGNSPLRWRRTCGDGADMCRGYMAPTDVTIKPCSEKDYKEGDTCPMDGLKCDPVDSCNVLLLCTSSTTCQP